jgi:hypothetical protein
MMMAQMRAMLQTEGMHCSMLVWKLMHTRRMFTGTVRQN